MTQLFINTVGHNASGKTTIGTKLVRKFRLDRVSGDDFSNFVYSHIAYFDNTSISFPNKRYAELNPLVLHYRFELTWTLLRANQNVLYDGSGSTAEIRAKYLQKIKADFPEAKTVIIWADIEESELVKRLARRDEEPGARWTDMYTQIKKTGFEPPQEGEADILLRYDQTNYDEIESEIHKLLML